MNSTLLYKKAVMVRAWWIHLLAGVLFILMSLWVITTPISSYVLLTVFFSLLMFVSGLFELIFAFVNYQLIDNWGWYFAAAAVDFLIALVLLIYPEITAIILPLLVACWLMFKGFAAVGLSIDLKHYRVRRWSWLFIAGMLTLCLAFLILVDPIIGGIGIIYLTSFALLSSGFFRIVLAFKLKRLHDKARYRLQAFDE